MALTPATQTAMRQRVVRVARVLADLLDECGSGPNSLVAYWYAQNAGADPEFSAADGQLGISNNDVLLMISMAENLRSWAANGAVTQADRVPILARVARATE